MTSDGDLLKGRRVLVIEDEMVVAMLLEDMLEDLGCQVAATAARTSEAMEAMASFKIDAAILDVNLDGERSYAIADALDDQGIPLIFSTGYGADAVAETYRRHPILAKPFRLNELADALRRLLSETRPSH